MAEKPKRTPRWLWPQKSDYARLERELSSFSVELDRLEATTENNDKSWIKAARSEIRNVEAYLEGKDNIEGGWVSLHAARRHAIRGLSAIELKLQASILRAEAPKLASWRGKEMLNLLQAPDAELTAHRIIEVMALRDEYSSNQYHQIWLAGRQISILLYCCGIGLLLLVPFVVSSSIQPTSSPLPPWGYQMVGAVLFFGLLGAAFSAAGSLMNANTVARIPERVANQFVTIARALFGAGIGLAGYAIYQAKILGVHFTDEGGPGGAIAIAFLFGFGGEMLIAKVLGSIGSRPVEAQK